MVDTSYHGLQTSSSYSGCLPEQLHAFQHVPYPVDRLLATYLPGWLLRFLKDVWLNQVLIKHFFLMLCMISFLFARIINFV